MKLSIQRRTFKFRFDARTSRGRMPDRTVWFVFLSDENASKTGWGEVAPLPGLSIESENQVVAELEQLQVAVSQCKISIEEPAAWIASLSDHPWCSSVRAGLEMAVHDLFHGGIRKIFPSSFFEGKPIPINGLIWMGEQEWMWQQVQEKMGAGFKCLKLKVGSLAFEAELELMQAIRNHPIGKDLTLRLDANGAFSPEEVMMRLESLARFEIHSIEQPIRAGQHQLLRKVCEASPIPVALDEELIGIDTRDARGQLLQESGADFVVLKPSLHGGFNGSAEWIKLAEDNGIGWWMTSALESPVGLNAIAQFTALYEPKLPQGLGTGTIYSENIVSPIRVENGFISYKKAENWGFVENTAKKISI